jgi:hypothetical protein
VVAQRRARAEAMAAASAAKGKVRLAEEALERFDIDHVKKVESARLPVPGLGFSFDGVTYKGVPFEQCSAAESLRVSAAIGFAMQPKLKLMLIYDGSLLDADSMEILANLAEEFDAQVLIERVEHGDEVGVRIVDGCNAADAPPVAAEQQNG